MMHPIQKLKIVVFCCVTLAFAVASMSLTYITRSPEPDGLAGGGARPTNSSTIALSADDRFIWVVNQDVNTVTVLNAADLSVVIEIPVGQEPRTVALTPNFAFVTNMVDATVSVISTTTYDVVATTAGGIGVEPYGIAVNPSGTKAYVANASSNSVSVMSTSPPFAVTRVIEDARFKDPRGIAITADGNTVFVTEFFAKFRTGILPGSDDEKEGRIMAIDGQRDEVIGEFPLDPMADTGFNADGSALERVAPPMGDPTRPPFNRPTGAYPNQLQYIAILGNHGYVPATAASPNGPVRFNVNTQGFLSVFNTVTLRHEPLNTINLNRGIQFEPSSDSKIFMSSPWAIAFKRRPRMADGIVEGWAVMQASDLAVKVEVNPTTGLPTINAPRMMGDPGNIRRVTDVGSAPRGIVINSTDTRAYVMNYVSRDVAAIDLTANPERVIARGQATALPQPGTLDRVVHEGKRLFFTSRGPIFTDSMGKKHFRMSREGWGSCVACHEDGRDDGVTWIFAAGPRRTINLAHSFSHLPANRACAPSEPCSDQRVLNWTAVFDEMEDFELNTRTVFGANDPREDVKALGGLITLADRNTPEVTANILSFFSVGIPQQNAYRPQVEISDGAQGIRAQNAIARYIQLGIRNRISPVAPDDTGRALFDQLNCTQCHSGPKWTISRVITRPPATADVQAGQFRPALKEVGTFNPMGRNEVNAIGGTPQGAFGFNPPSLLGIFANAAGFLHNSGALTLASLLDGSQGCVGGTPANCVHNISAQTSEDDRAALIRFLLSIDESTDPFPVPSP